MSPNVPGNSDDIGYDGIKTSITGRPGSLYNSFKGMKYLSQMVKFMPSFIFWKYKNNILVSLNIPGNGDDIGYDGR